MAPIMIQGAAQLLEIEGLDPLTRVILSLIAVLDRCGAWTWNLRLVGAATAVILLLIRQALHKKRGVDWYPLAHAIVTAFGSLMCVYLDVYAAQALTGTPEPLRSCQCQPPLTSLHRILPAITMGYSLFDILDGMTISIAFALHGAATLSIMAFFCELDRPHIITPMLLMEVSTVFLTVVRADFFSTTVAALNQACFALNFFAFRIVIVPFLWGKLMLAMYEQKDTADFVNCFPPYFLGVCFGFGMFFNILNAYWWIKIVQKIQRKISGVEKVHDNNDLSESGHQKGD
jgi:TLC domain